MRSITSRVGFGTSSFPCRGSKVYTIDGKPACLFVTENLGRPQPRRGTPLLPGLRQSIRTWLRSNGLGLRR